MNRPGKHNVCIGGTFSPFHKGHERLLRETFKRGKKVFIGLTSDSMARRSRNRQVMTFEERAGNLEKVLKDLSEEFNVTYSLREIHDRFGFAVKEEIDAIVVSRETASTVDDIDRERIRRGLLPLKRFVLDMVLDEKGERISSTRVVRGEIDRNGKLRNGKTGSSKHHVCVHLASKNSDKVTASIKAFRKYWPEVQVFKYDIERGQGSYGIEGPVDGARKRIEDLKKRLDSDQMTDRDHLVGIEAGSINLGGVWFFVDVCYISHIGGEGFGSSSGLEIPPTLMENIMVYRGKTWEIKDVTGMRTSIIENLSGGSMSRESLIEQAVEMALLSMVDSLRKEEEV